MVFAFWLKNHEHQPHYLHHRWLWLLHTQPYTAKLIPADFCWLRLKMVKPVDVLENAQKWGGSTFKGGVPDRVVDRGFYFLDPPGVLGSSSTSRPSPTVRLIRMVTPPWMEATQVYDLTINEEDEEVLNDREIPAVQFKTFQGPESGERASIILDSGADASMVPARFHGLGQPSRDGQAPELADAQGNSIPAEEVRDYEFWLKDRKGQHFLIREACVVGNVKVPLLAVGKLFRKGWQLVREEGNGLSLVEPFGRSAAVGFKNHSLMINGSVRALTEVPRTLPARVPQVFLPQEILEKSNVQGMHKLKFGPEWMLHVSRASTCLFDPRDWLDPAVWPCRMTFLQKDNGDWLQVENSADYINEANPFAVVSATPRKMFIEYQDSQIVPSIVNPLSHEQRTNLFTTQRA